MAFRFMGEQEDPELDVWMGRGLRVYDGTHPVERLPEVPEPRPVTTRSPWAGPWVLNGGAFVRCGCGRCFTGPCPSPR